jgi:CheY-like chemotaxis protein
VGGGSKADDGEKFPAGTRSNFSKSGRRDNPIAVFEVNRGMTTSIVRTDGIIVGADDDADDVDLLRLLLRKAGVDCPQRFYRHGEEVIAAFREFAQAAIRPLLCFLDVKMPAITGHDLLRWIREQPKFNSMPIVMLSSSDHPRDIKEAVERGAQCYLAKYPQPSVLREVISEAWRFVEGTPAGECFRFPTNLLLVRGRRV